MLRKTLVAFSLMGLASQGVASTLTATAIEKSEQAILTSTVVAGPSFTLATGVAVASGSTLQLDYSAAPTNPSVISASLVAGADGTKCGTNAAITYAGVTNGGKTANYTVATTAGNVRATCLITFGAVANKAPLFAKADVQAAPVTVGASFTVVGAGVDPSVDGAGKAASPALVKMATGNQFGFTVTTAANAIVDVEEDREKFTAAFTDNDTIVLKYTDVAAQGATGNKAIYTITGDFAWADDPLTEGFQILSRDSNVAIAVTGTGVAFGNGVTAAKPTATTLTIIDTNPTHNESITVTFKPLVDTNVTAPNTDKTDDVLAVALPNGTYTVAADVSFTDEVSGVGVVAGTGVLALPATAGNGGAWGLNGATVKVFAVPFGSEVESHSIFVSNSGAATGAITASVAWNGNAPVKVALGDIMAKGNTYINLMGALEALGEKPLFGRADVTFTVNAPAGDITFTAAYNTAAGRANLYMQQQATMATIANSAKVNAAAADAAADVACANLAYGQQTASDAAVAANTQFDKNACP